MKKRKFLKINTEKTELINRIKYLKYDVASKERIIKRLFARLREKNEPYHEEIYMICTSYESGFGHGVANDGLDLSKTPHAQEWLGEAYQIGYEAGHKKYVEVQHDHTIAINCSDRE